MYWLQSADGAHRVEATAGTVQMSLLMQELEDEEEVVVTVPRCVLGECFDAINSFCDLASTSPLVVPVSFTKRSFDQDIPAAYRPWLARLFPLDKPQPLVYDVLEAANFLQIGLLVDVCCAKLAALMLCRTVGEIQELFR